jgi:hypothetical protein
MSLLAIRTIGVDHVVRPNRKGLYKGRDGLTETALYYSGSIGLSGHG